MASSRYTNLPLQLSSFIGRQREISEVKRLLGTTRLLTLTGAGGSGKTRLAIKVAEDLLEEYRDDAWFADLAPLSNPELLAQTIVSIFGISETTTASPIETLQTYLHTKTLLLILDNCEHLIEACAGLSDTLLRTCPELRILATSREALHIAGEMTFRVPSLSLPDSKGSSRFEELLHFESIQLFEARAQAVDPTFQLTIDNVSPIEQICARLDGMPLAIELAAARADSLSVQQIAEKLDDRFRLLTSGSRTAPTRQQTLRATMDWDYELLSEPEKSLLRRLSVFAGGWTLEAAEYVTGDCPASNESSGYIGGESVLDPLSRLIGKSLVLAEKHDQETRYRMLETIRQYGREKLDASGEAEQIRDRHLEFFMSLAEMAEPQLRGPEQVSWINRLENEHDNFRAALEAAVEKQSFDPSDIEWLPRLAVALEPFWEMHSHFHEARRWLQTALKDSKNISVHMYAKVLGATGYYAMRQSDNEEAEALLDQSLCLYREQGDQQNIAVILRAKGLLLADQGDFAEATKLVEESLKICRQRGNSYDESYALGVLGEMALAQGDHDCARGLIEQSLSLSREIGDTVGIALGIAALCNLALHQGDYDRAAELNAESLVLFQKVDSARLIMLCHDMAGRIAHGRGENTAARVSLLEALHGFSELGDKWGFAQGLEHLAIVNLDEGDLAKAARMFGAAEVLRDDVNLPMDLTDRESYEQSLAALHKQLDDEKFTEAWEAGRAMTIEQAIAEAEQMEVSEQARPAEPEYPAGLTEREVEVLRWLAKGLSNQQIADKLVLSRRTVDAHLRSIYRKIDVTTRGAAIRMAIESKLI